MRCRDEEMMYDNDKARREGSSGRIHYLGMGRKFENDLYLSSHICPMVEIGLVFLKKITYTFREFFFF